MKSWLDKQVWKRDWVTLGAECKESFPEKRKEGPTPVTRGGSIPWGKGVGGAGHEPAAGNNGAPEGGGQACGASNT